MIFECSMYSSQHELVINSMEYVLVEGLIGFVFESSILSKYCIYVYG